MTIFIDGLDPSIRTLVARHREQRPRHELTYQELAQFARDEGDAYRARRQVTVQPKVPRIPRASIVDRAQANMLLTPVPSVATGSGHSHDDLFIIGSEQELESDRTSDLPSTDPSIQAPPQQEAGNELESADSEVDATLYASAGPPRIARPQPVPFQNAGTSRARPGWVDRNRHQPQPPTCDASIICQTCYAPGHYANECKLQFHHFLQIVKNFDALPNEQRAALLRRSYDRALSLSRLDQGPAEEKK